MKQEILSMCLLTALVLSGCQGKGPTNPSNAGLPPTGTEVSHIYATSVKYTAEHESAQDYLEIAQRSAALYACLETHNDAFLMDGYNYQSIDDDGTPVYTQNTMDRPIEIDSAGHCIRVSMNYFHHNPIETVTGTAIEDLAIYEENTLNILVPESLQRYKEDLIAEYRQLFYFEKVEVANLYNEALGLPPLPLSADDLQVNLIYVRDHQSYFTYRPDIAAQTERKITDPIVVLYTGNIHVSYVHSFMTQSVYFYSDGETALEAYDDILPHIRQVGGEESFQKVLAVSEEFS